MGLSNLLGSNYLFKGSMTPYKLKNAITLHERARPLFKWNDESLARVIARKRDTVQSAHARPISIFSVTFQTLPIYPQNCPHGGKTKWPPLAISFLYLCTDHRSSLPCPYCLDPVSPNLMCTFVGKP